MIRKNAHPCFVALTRPPMRFGVTLTFLMLNALSNLFLWILLKKAGLSFMFFLGTGAVFHLIGLIACRYDPLFFDLMLGKMTFLNDQNYDVWGCRSYESY
jgi:type IV secretory pathway VirB3-like protein